MISVLILTRNEEADLPGCLRSVRWSDDVHVFDSLSTDRTCAMAQEAGAKISRRPFDNYASHRNAALHGLRFKNPWVLSLDADERVPVELACEMLEFARNSPEGTSAARIRRRDIFMGRWLKHAQISPFFVRLVRPERVRYERAVNEVLKVRGEIAELAGSFDHHPFSKGITHWINKHNVYSTMEAEILHSSQSQTGEFSLKQALFAPDFNERRVHQKVLFYRMPCRPVLKFAYMMLGRRAFLDGAPGITYSLLQSIYEYFIVLKTRELRRAQVPALSSSTAEAEPTIPPSPAAATHTTA